MKEIKNSTYCIRIHNKEWLDFNMHIGANNRTYFRASGDKHTLEFVHIGRLIYLTNYGEQADLGIPNWAVEESFNPIDNPEYFI